jgi:hypothetical protein
VSGWRKSRTIRWRILLIGVRVAIESLVEVVFYLQSFSSFWRAPMQEPPGKFR